jgi:hypothetical protein
VKYGTLNYKGKTDSTFPVDSGFICSNDSVTKTMLRDKINVFQ